MSRGTASGLLDTAQAQSVFKHGILKRYVIQFAIMTASKLVPKRAVLLDGFAGRGRFDNGSAASAEYLMIDAQKAQGRGTQVDVFLVEKARDDYERLDEVAQEYRDRGLVVEVRHGECQDYLSEVVDLAAGASLFMFLDPCGANIPFDDLVRVLGTDRASDWPRTEALLNINADIIRRSAGLVFNNPDGNTDTLDTMCGGQWWRQVAIDAYEASGRKNWTVAADAVVQEYATRLATAVGRTGWAITEVRRKEHHEPVYYLVFLTRDHHGFWAFGESNAKARYEWLAHLAEENQSDQLELVPFDVKETAKSEQAGFKARIRENLQKLIDVGEPFIPLRKFAQVLEGVYGDAEEKTANAAIREAEKAGDIICVKKEKQPHRSTWKKSD